MVQNSALRQLHLCIML